MCQNVTTMLRSASTRRQPACERTGAGRQGKFPMAVLALLSALLSGPCAAVAAPASGPAVALPEPFGAGVFAVGLLLLAIVRRRRQRLH